MLSMRRTVPSKHTLVWVAFHFQPVRGISPTSMFDTLAHCAIERMPLQLDRPVCWLVIFSATANASLNACSVVRIIHQLSQGPSSGWDAIRWHALVADLPAVIVVVLRLAHGCQLAPGEVAELFSARVISWRMCLPHSLPPPPWRTNVDGCLPMTSRGVFLFIQGNTAILASSDFVALPCSCPTTSPMAVPPRFHSFHFLSKRVGLRS